VVSQQPNIQRARGQALGAWLAIVSGIARLTGLCYTYEVWATVVWGGRGTKMLMCVVFGRLFQLHVPT